MWPLRGQRVRYGSTNKGNSVFHPSEVGKWVVIHVITWNTGGWRPLNSRPGLRVAVCSYRSKCVDACLAYCLRPLCVWHKSAAAAAVCGLSRYKCYVFALVTIVSCATLWAECCTTFEISDDKLFTACRRHNHAVWMAMSGKKIKHALLGKWCAPKQRRINGVSVALFCRQQYTPPCWRYTKMQQCSVVKRFPHCNYTLFVHIKCTSNMAAKILCSVQCRHCTSFIKRNRLIT